MIHVGCGRHIDKILAFENGELSFDETVNLFQELIDDGLCWKLQGIYGRQAMVFIEAGYCHKKGEAKNDKE